MVEQIEHIGIAIKDATTAVALYTQLLGVPPYKDETVESQGVRTIFFQVGESKIELLEPIRDDSPIAKFIAKRGEGIHHIAYRVADLEAALAEKKAQGFQLINQAPVPGADGMRIAFLHPKGTNGVLTELCQPMNTAN